MRPALIFTFTLLLIELLDELVYGAQGAALPAIRNDLQLSYEQIGILLSVPHLLSSLVEPVIGILGDTWRRKWLIVGGGIAFTVGIALIALGQSFVVLLLALTLMFPASGAFVSLSQATLMDLNPTRHDQLMVRWTLFGSIGVVGGSLLISALLAALGSWRPLFFVFTVIMLLLTLLVAMQRNFPQPSEGEPLHFREGLRTAVNAMRDVQILRWLVLLDLADLAGDVLIGFVALYFADVVLVSEAEAALAVTTLTVAGLIGHALVIPLIDRVKGLTYVRVSALVVLALYALLLLVPDVIVKYVLLACIGVAASGWYAVLRGRLYSAMPNQSGISIAVTSAWGIVSGLVPALLGVAAEVFGLPLTMALLALGPIGLIVGVPKERVKPEG